MIPAIHDDLFGGVVFWTENVNYWRSVNDMGFHLRELITENDVEFYRKSPKQAGMLMLRDATRVAASLSEYNWP